MQTKGVVIIKRVLKALFSISVVFSVTVMSLVAYFDKNLSAKYLVAEGETLKFSNKNCVTVSYAPTVESDAVIDRALTRKSVSLKLFGVFPIKNASIETVSDSYVYVIGKPFGIKIYTDGVLVVGINEIITDSGKITPAKKAGIEIGDSIISVNGKKITSNEELSRIIEESGGNAIKISGLHDGKPFSTLLYPVMSSDTNTYKAGIWIRDSSAGIGTLTYYSPASKTVGGLGHGICDSDTDKLLSLSKGELVFAEIVSCKPSESGSPGELVGRFKSGSIAPLLINSEEGVYGLCDADAFCNCNLLKVANKQEVTDGKAQILTTVDGTEPELYDCTVRVRATSDNEPTQNITVTVTDKKLINKTGGIVQGMSGSPLIQNGKLIGAITHVLVDDPTTGYAIFAENMLETAQTLANKGEIKDAS